jgi:putative CocE/NonD family hydrolase
MMNATLWPAFGDARSLAGNGGLSVEPPGDEAPDTYVYDPEDPTPTRGGNGLGLSLGVLDQSAIERRKDVLVYTGDALDADLEITGPVKLKLFAASSAPDTDFMAKLVDVRPDGYAQNLAEGVLRLRFRDPTRSPSLTTRGEVLDLTLDIGVTSHVFRAGHRLRVDLTSSNFPRLDRNANTGDTLWQSATAVSATQTVFTTTRGRLILSFRSSPRHQAERLKALAGRGRSLPVGAEPRSRAHQGLPVPETDRERRRGLWRALGQRARGA